MITNKQSGCACDDSMFLDERLRSPSFFIRWRGYGVKFHKNLCGKVYSMVRDEDATRFASQAEAARACATWRLKVGEIEIVTVE